MKIVVTGGAGSDKSTLIKSLREALGSTFAYANVDDAVWANPQILLQPSELETFRGMVNGKTMEQVREQVFTDERFKFKLEEVFKGAVRYQIEEAMEHLDLVLESRSCMSASTASSMIGLTRSSWSKQAMITTTSGSSDSRLVAGSHDQGCVQVTDD
jgi:hypothetical protein